MEIDEDVGRPIPLFTIDDNKKFVFNEEIESLFSRDEIMDHTAMIISVAGDFRTGKSFLLNFFLRYLNFTYTSSKDSNSWIEDGNVLQGFLWKCTKNRVTTGIDVWSKPVCTILPSGEKVAIFLLDTQGLNDSSTPFGVNVKVFSLSTLLSSVQVYNLSKQIQEDNLQMLKIFTDYSKLASASDEYAAEAPFQKLLFLVRDWSYPHDNSFGFKGGNELVEEKLRIDKPDEELNSVRKHLKSCFTIVEGFLMPDPGQTVKQDPNFEGQLSGISKEFQNSLKELVPSLLGPQNLLPKKINGQTVKVSNLLLCLRNYMNMMNCGEDLTPKSIIDANAQSSRLQAFQAAIEECRKHLERVFEDTSKLFLESNEIPKEDDVVRIASERYKNHPKLCENDAAEEKMLLQLRQVVKDMYDFCRERNNKKRECHRLKIELKKQQEETAQMKREIEKTRRQVEEIRKNATATSEMQMKKMEEKIETMTRCNKERFDELQQKVSKLEKEIEDNELSTIVMRGISNACEWVTTVWNVVKGTVLMAVGKSFTEAFPSIQEKGEQVVRGLSTINIGQPSAI